MTDAHLEALAAVERQHTGATLTPAEMAKILIDAQGRSGADVAAVEVHWPGQPVVRTVRQPGEALAALVSRACPAGAVVAPIFCGAAGESDLGRDLRLTLGACARLRVESLP